MKITAYREIAELPVGTVANIARKYSASDWVKTSGSTWASLHHDYTQDQVDDYVARKVNNVSPYNDGEYTILNPEYVISALIRDVQIAKAATSRESASGRAAKHRLYQIEELINGNHDCKEA